MPRKTKVTRRGKNEGSVYQRKDGRWVGQVTVGYREDNGKPIRRYTYQATREEAARWVALQVATELDRAGSVRSGELLLRDFLHNWLAAFKVHEVCSRTMALYYDAERLHIAPALGDLPLGEVTPLKIQTFLYQLQAEKRLRPQLRIGDDLRSSYTGGVQCATAAIRLQIKTMALLHGFFYSFASRAFSYHETKT